MKKFLAIAAATAAIVALSATPAQATTNSAPAGTIVDVALAASGGGTPDANNQDYDLLVQALLATELAPVLADTSTQFTVFAPNDRAFLRLVEDLTGVHPASEAEALTTITTALTIPQISNVLLYHVVPGQKLGPIKVLLSRELTVANGGIVKPRGIVLKDESPAFRDPKLVLRAINIQASNGVIHTIDRVLIPGNL